ncbi:GNAT family N-acetyltransferase [Flavilitoribacter nigricans]|uniref:N-acetyltransferase n=1 Tax=Flavilitoribacter nigricans (strain ATCC 23147 / DSM 23189 / NBRC 102662 / NCIMB 1420 / SS-2) TaxID=1122177 RepID=A0A2D0N8N2_FLAN2|nr:GNAT family N-acetyltransferase [Flavilitoribacter nigricans]PHN04740.1 N-acetyltransferase [Flavilitoribacter nigricans DSM 23189 = NBRC 102662]
MHLNIRPAGPDDLPAILDIVNHIILTTTTNYSYEPESLADRQAWLTRQQAADMPVIVAERDGILVGFGSYGPFRNKIGYRFTVEHSVYVHRDHHHLGIGQKLLEELIRLARAQGMHIMIAGVDTQNQGSFLFHQKMGFEPVAHFREVGFKFGQWLDLMFLQLYLSE